MGAFGLWTAEMSDLDRSGLFRYNTLVFSDECGNENVQLSEAHETLGILWSSLSTRGSGWAYVLEASELDHGQSFTTRSRITINHALRNLLQIVYHRLHTNSS